MKIITFLTLISNFLTIFILLFGLLYKFKNPKNKAKYGIVLACIMLAYTILLSLFILFNTLLKQNFLTMLLIFCVVSPFIIGSLVKFETLKKYTILQILCFSISLVYLFYTI